MRVKTLIRPARPFGAGNRRCFGQRFAMHILQSAVGEVLRHCRISCAPSSPGRFLDSDAGGQLNLVNSPVSGHRSPSGIRLKASSSGGLLRITTDHGVHLMSNTAVCISPLTNRKYVPPPRASGEHTPTNPKGSDRSDNRDKAE